jgi:monoamine oxidase
MNYRTFSDETVLLGISVGAHALVADKMSRSAMTADALEVLRSVWGDRVGSPVQVLTTHWSQDRETLGAYTYPTPGSRPSDFDGLGEGIDDVVFLCGEHTTFDYAGTVHGAYLTGLRAARRVAEQEG